MSMNQWILKGIGAIMIVIGLLTALTRGQNQGFSAGSEAAVAYIGGFVLAFLGVYFLIIHGRQKAPKDDYDTIQ